MPCVADIDGRTPRLAIEGMVDSATADSVTIKLESGQTVTVGLDDDTTYHRQSDAAATDVQAGETVILRIAGGFRFGGTRGRRPWARRRT